MFLTQRVCSLYYWIAGTNEAVRLYLRLRLRSWHKFDQRFIRIADIHCTGKVTGESRCVNEFTFYIILLHYNVFWVKKFNLMQNVLNFHHFIKWLRFSHGGKLEGFSFLDLVRTWLNTSRQKFKNILELFSLMSTLNFYCPTASNVQIEVHYKIDRLKCTYSHGNLLRNAHKLSATKIEHSHGSN